MVGIRCEMLLVLSFLFIFCLCRLVVCQTKNLIAFLSTAHVALGSINNYCDAGEICCESAHVCAPRGSECCTYNSKGYCGPDEQCCANRICGKKDAKCCLQDISVSLVNRNAAVELISVSSPRTKRRTKVVATRQIVPLVAFPKQALVFFNPVAKMAQCVAKPT